MQWRPKKAPAAPSSADLLQRALAALNDGEPKKAVAWARDATSTGPTNAGALEILSIALYRAGEFAEAVAVGRKAISLDPKNAEFHANLGVVLRAANLPNEAREAYTAAIACDPAFAPGHHNLGNLLSEEGALAGAEACFRKAVELRPNYMDAWNGLGVALQKQGRLADAAGALRTALGFAPDNAQLLCDLATCVMGLDRKDEAHELLTRAVKLAPNFASAHGNLGALYLRAGRLVDAETATQRAVALAPSEHRWIANLAVIAKDLGRFGDAEGLFRRALALKPDYALAHSNLLFCVNYHPTRTAADIFAEYRRFDAAHAQRHLPAKPAFANDPNPDRRLRVGLLSPDFREHSGRHFIEPLLAHVDRSRMELFCYAEVPNPDATTRHFQSLAGHWRSTVGLSDDAVAELIGRDRIDVVMDLGGHTASSRLLALARKPAPVQVAYLLGHGYTSGLTAMDAFLADAALVPPGSEDLFSEQVVRLPRIPIAYTPPAGMPAVGTLPALTNGHVTFGYFGRPERLNDKVVSAWAAILQRVPGSRLTLNSKAFGEAAFRARMAERFAAHGIAAARLDMVYTSPQPRTWEAYGTIDIALDPFPHNAGTTTIEALWLGVPVLSLADRPSVGRFGASILGSMGLADWVAGGPQAYVDLAAAKTRDLAALAALRASLRGRFAASPLADAPDLAVHIHAAFRTLWKNWCEKQARATTATVEAARTETIASAGRLSSEGRHTDAVALWLEHVRRYPTDAEAFAHLSDHYRLLGRLADAEAAARDGLRLQPGKATVANALGNALAAQGRLLEAEAAFATAIQANPHYAEAYNNRALALMRRGQFSAAESDLRAAMALRPDLAEMGFNLAGALQDQGRVPEAVDEFRKAVAKSPRHATGHGMMLFCATYHPGLAGEEIFAEFRKWNEAHAQQHAPKNAAWSNDKNPARRLRIGYVSPDFGTKSARHFIEPMLAGHDRAKVEIFAYSEVIAPDAETDRLKALADHWRPTVGLSDEALAALVRQDRIDVLVDLGGHTARNRLLALARKPAPVQVAHFLGHGYTSGLGVMDAFLADARLAPEGCDRLFSEPVQRLPRIPIAYAPPAGMPAVSPLPALQRGYITFGHFGRAIRLNDDVVTAWARILNAVPKSRLVLNTVSFADDGVCRRFRELFARHGIAADRLDLIFTTPQPRTWEAYGGIDIALDAFPHNAGTTTIEALWLGVPSVALADRPSVGRFGASILGAVGLDAWVARSIDDYVMKAVTAARDVKALARLRASLRPTMQASPLCDGRGLSAALENTYRDLWRAYCDREARIDGLQAEAGKAYSAGDPSRAAELFGAALRLAQRADILSNLGAALRAAGRHEDAEAAYRQAIARAPDFAAAHGNLGNLLNARGRAAEAEAALRCAHQLNPDDAEVLRNLALSLMGQSRPDEAQPLLERAVALAPRNGDMHDNLAQVLRQRGQPMAAALRYQAAEALIANNHRAIANRALSLQDLGRFGDAEGLFRRALALKPDYALAHSNLLFCVNYHPTRTAADIFAEYRRFDAAHAQRHLPAKPAFANDPNPDRRLRVGLLSPDFREHSGRHFIEPLLAHVDRSRMELFCYAEVPNPDATTRHFQSLAGHWRSTVGLSDDAVAELIGRDRIDVVMDLGGHTASSRLLALARKPAPVQVAYLLGHGYTSGLTAMDAFLADAALVPPGSEDLFSEQVVRLPRIPIAYTPPAGMPAVGTLPALTNGHVTFGYFGRPERLNDKVVSAWAAILQRVPGSRLTLNSKAFGEAAFRARMAERFAAHGIAAARLDMVYTSPQPRTWEAYGTIDIALDPFPHNAGTTTIEALWLGVPVLSLADRPSVGRFGASILGSMGLADWVAGGPQAYVDLAAAKTRDLAALAALRASLRGRFAASPLADAPDLAVHIHAAFRTLWKNWCEKQARATTATVEAAIAAYAAGNFERAWAVSNACLQGKPQDTEARHLRGIAAYRLGRLEEAAWDLGEAVQEAPKRADWRWNLAAILRSLGRLKEAEAQGREAVRLAPDAPEARNNLGSILRDLGCQAEAEGHYRRAVALRPTYADAWSNLAWALSVAGNAKQAAEAARRALALNPGDANAHNNLGSALMQQDQLREAGESFERAVALRPDFAMAHSNLLFCLNYRTDLTAEQIFTAYQKWNSAHAQALMPASPAFANVRDPERRLRIGYVSPDFRHHAASFFVEPMLAGHDRTRFEVTCYAEVQNPDAVTERFKSIADRWRSTVGLGDAAVAELVRADGIDVLVDLAGHTSGNRLLAFARKPAPVQVAHMVGSGMTTGLPAIDAFLADHDLAPRGSEHLFAERVLRLPRIPLVYAPPDGMPPVRKLPALLKGYITFGCFSRTARINEQVIEAWARILEGVAGARLVLNSKPFQEAESRAHWHARFKAHGIASDRIDLIYTSPQPKTWDAYGQIDIALDPFPHNAGTTTIEALWMGVPVVSLADRPPVGRFGASILGSLDMHDWVAGTVDQYVARAISAAAGRQDLARLRAGLRDQFKSSPLGANPAALAREIESVYRQLWRDYCTRASGQALQTGHMRA